jgi:hypothetical protein
MLLLPHKLTFTVLAKSRLIANLTDLLPDFADDALL